MSKNKGTLFLIPNVIADGTAEAMIAPQVRDIVKNTSYYLVENLRTARRYISSLKLGLTIEALELEVLDKKTKDAALAQLMKPVMDGRDVGIISESGCPGIADPGALAVEYAHKHGIRVIPLVGPSSLFMALMSSGFSGQHFAFSGYLPIDKKRRIDAIKKLELTAREKYQTQIFMETPYRNDHLFADLVKTCSANVKLCIAKDVSGQDEMIMTKTIAEWKKVKLSIGKFPTIFVLSA